MSLSSPGITVKYCSLFLTILNIPVVICPDKLSSNTVSRKEGTLNVFPSYSPEAFIKLVLDLYKKPYGYTCAILYYQ